MTASSLRLRMRMRELPWLLEELTIRIGPGGDYGLLDLQWEVPEAYGPIQIAGG